MTHLWEVNKPYYCEASSYFSSERECKTKFEYNSFDEFLEEWEDADYDMNLLFRWDWIAVDEYDEEDEIIPVPEGQEPNYVLRLYYMLQRKGYKVSCHVTVTQADEQRVIEYLKPRIAYMKDLVSLPAEPPPQKYWHYTYQWQHFQNKRTDTWLSGNSVFKGSFSELVLFIRSLEYPRTLLHSQEITEAEYTKLSKISL